MTQQKRRRYALLAGVGGAFVLFLVLRGRGGGAPAADELLAAGGAAPAGSIDAGGGGAAMDPNFVAMIEDRLAQQNALVEGLATSFGDLRGNVTDLEDFLMSMGASLSEDQWAWPEEPAPGGPTDPGGPIFPRMTRGGVEVEAGVFQPVSWFFRELEPFASIFAGFRTAQPGAGAVSGINPAPSTNDPGPGGQAPPAAPGNRRASLAFSRLLGVRSGSGLSRPVSRPSLGSGVRGISGVGVRSAAGLSARSVPRGLPVVRVAAPAYSFSRGGSTTARSGNWLANRAQ